ncbi:MAG TPA: RodZ domain-containing protein [Xanthomonadaceae bacterium]|nr:RodZ domain-containing protein [Xanthomonadaceae bacterium]
MHDNQAAPEGTRGVGERLRRAREAAGLRLEDVAERLKMPVRVVRSLEEEDWSRLGAPVFVRGQLRSYSRLLGLGTSTTIEAARVGPVEPPALVTHNFVPRHQRVLEQFSRRAAYIAITVAIAGSVWMGTRTQMSVPAGNVAPLDVPVTAAPTAGAIGTQPPATIQRTPMIASMGPSAGSATTVPATPTLSLELGGDSWIEVTGRDGQVIEKGLLSEGTTRSFDLRRVGAMVIGNAGAVVVERDGQPVALDAFQRANVARFTVSSDGSLAPVDD